MTLPKIVINMEKGGVTQIDLTQCTDTLNGPFRMVYNNFGITVRSQKRLLNKKNPDLGAIHLTYFDFLNDLGLIMQMSDDKFHHKNESCQCEHSL